MRQRDAARIVRRYQKALNLEDWRIRVVCIRLAALKAAGITTNNVHGACARDVDARRAVVYLVSDRARKLNGDEVAPVSDEAVLAHEVAHIACALGEERLCEIIAGLLTNGKP